MMVFLLKDGFSQVFSRIKIAVCLLIAGVNVQAQRSDGVLVAPDTLTATIKAYDYNRSAIDIPASVSSLSGQQLQRFSNSSPVTAMNTLPGVRMEERSPGSYRINMRGSSLRSPFGIRNVKFYLNGIPFTDPGGNTYLNQLDFNQLSSIEILRGPASSLYGAGSGGAVLLQTLDEKNLPAVQVAAMGGSYGLFGASASIGWQKEGSANRLSYSHQQSDGWRNHTAMRRDIASYESRFKLNNKQSLQVTMLYGDLYYQTPGALTLAQFKANPRAARPASGGFPSADDAKAAIYQKTFLAGITHTYQLAANWKNETSIYGAASWFNNPTFRLYEKRTEPHFGGRTAFTSDFVIGKHLLHVVYGAEAQKGIFTSQTYRIKQGNPDSILTNDEVNNWRYSLFAQAEWLLPKGWSISGGVSYNQSHVGITRLLQYPIVSQKRTYSSELAPRIALLKKLGQVSLYANASKGFSPPTTAEVLPGTAEINTALEAEHGINYEVGAKAVLFKQKWWVELAAYRFSLTNAISQRRDAGGGDYYVNAGKTKQYGVEFSTNYLLVKKNTSWLRQLQPYASYTYNHYEYADYKVIEANYDGKQLPGIPRHNLVLGVDAGFATGFYANANWQYVDKIAMNDANSEFADAYRLLSARVGWRMPAGKKPAIDVYVAADNLLDEVYSLGNDINAAGNRFYNAAMRRNFVAGVKLAL